MLEKLKELDRKLQLSPEERTAEERRREPREELTDGRMTILGESYPIHNWSVRGFMLHSCPLDRGPGDRLEVEVSIPLPGQRLKFACRAIVVRASTEQQRLAGVFVGVDKDTQATIDEHFGIHVSRSWSQDIKDRIKSYSLRPKQKA
jgi:hypothetical protein